MAKVTLVDAAAGAEEEAEAVAVIGVVEEEDALTILTGNALEEFPAN